MNTAGLEAIQCCFGLETHKWKELGDRKHCCHEESNSLCSEDQIAFTKLCHSNTSKHCSRTINWCSSPRRWVLDAQYHRCKKKKNQKCMFLHDKITGYSIQMITKTQISQLVKWTQRCSSAHWCMKVTASFSLCGQPYVAISWCATELVWKLLYLKNCWKIKYYKLILYESKLISISNSTKLTSLVFNLLNTVLEISHF